MPAPDKSGAPTVRALGSDEAGAWLQELLPGREGLRTTSHSLKATLLSFAAKRGLTHIDRLALGGHYHGAHMSDVCARDALARPLRLLAGMLTEIRLGKFLPDSGRAARFPHRSNEEIIGAGRAPDGSGCQHRCLRLATPRRGEVTGHCHFLRGSQCWGLWVRQLVELFSVGSHLDGVGPSNLAGWAFCT